MFKHLGIVTILCFGFLALQFCCKPVIGLKTAAPTQPTARPTVGQQEHIIYVVNEKRARFTLQRYLRVVRCEGRREDSGLLTAFAVFNNLRHKDLWVEIQTVFLDSDMVEIERTNLQPMQFVSGVNTTFKQTSISTHATDFRFYIRKPRITG